jgi:hypothetical protein
MGRNLLKISIVVLSLLIASTSAAEELIQNGGFESGDLSPWEKVGDINSWRVSDEQVLEGMYSGYVERTDQLRQSFGPRLGSKFEVFSLAVMTAMGGTYVALEIEYADSAGSTPVNILVPDAFRWHTFDLLNHIDPDREVSGLVLTGHRSGYLPYHTRTWFDAITLQNNSEEDPDDPTGSDETERISADLKKLRVKFDLKKPRTRLDITLLAEEVPEGIDSGPVDIRVQLTQGDLTTEFDATAELIEVPHKKDHMIQFKEESSADKTP